MSTDESGSSRSETRHPMEEVERRSRERQRGGLLGDGDDALPFAAAALEDDLAAAANRVAAAARVPSIVPDLRIPAPHDDHEDAPTSRSPDADVEEEPERAGKLAEASAGPPASELILRAVSSAGRKAFRMVAGDRIDRFVDGSVEFFYATAVFARVASERLMALERRVRELEESQKETAPPKPASRRKAATSAASKSSRKSTPGRKSSSK